MPPLFKAAPLLKAPLGKSLLSRYIGIASLAVLLAQSLVGVTQIWRGYHHQMNTLHEKALEQGKFLSGVAPEAIFNLDFLYLENLVCQISKDQEIIYTVILDRNGRPLTQHLNRQDSHIAQAISTSPQSTPLLSIIGELDQHHQIRTLELPILASGKPLGFVKVGYTTQSIYSNMWYSVVATIVSILVISILLSLITFFVFKRAVYRPLQRLVQLAAEFEEGHLDHRVFIDNSNEIGSLGRALNQMAEELQKNLDSLSEARDMAISANQAKSDFLANMSHELRTPLNAILGFSQLMGRDLSLSPHQKETLDTINRSGSHLLMLINDVLDMSKIEAGRMTRHDNDCDVHALFNSIHDLFRLKAESKGIAWEIQRSPHIPQHIRIDEAKLRQVLINLIGNALKFTQQGEVKVRVWCDEDLTSTTQPGSLWFEVRDTGLGIAEQELTTIFEPFSQTETGRSSQEGTGLGLSISQKFLQLMGGDLTIQSQLGQGTQIQCSVQATALVKQQQTLPDQRQVLKLAPGQPSYRLLIVEDQSENCQLLTQLMESVGFKVKVAQDGSSAVQQWQDWQPHLIWMDLRLPVIDGFQATHQIRLRENHRPEPAEHPAQASPHRSSETLPRSVPHTVIVALTAFAFEEHRQRALTTGFDDYIRKPWQEDEIFEKLRQHLNVQYVYADESETANRATGSETSAEVKLEPALVSQHLVECSEKLRSQLYAGAARLDKANTLEAIQALATIDLPLANTLRDWVNAFRFDKVLQVLGAELNEVPREANVQ